MFGVIEAERTVNGKTSCERRLYIGSIAPDASTLATVVRAHWGIENRVHWCLDVALNDGEIGARMKNAGANLAIVRRILAASSDSYRNALLGLDSV